MLHSSKTEVLSFTSISLFALTLCLTLLIRVRVCTVLLQMMRSKKKYLFDWSFTLTWNVDLKDAGACTGTLVYPDVTPDGRSGFWCSSACFECAPPPTYARACNCSYMCTL